MVNSIKYDILCDANGPQGKTSLSWSIYASNHTAALASARKRISNLGWDVIYLQCIPASVQQKAVKVTCKHTDIVTFCNKRVKELEEILI